MRLRDVHGSAVGLGYGLIALALLLVCCCSATVIR